MVKKTHTNRKHFIELTNTLKDLRRRSNEDFQLKSDEAKKLLQIHLAFSSGIINDLINNFTPILSQVFI